jgi:phenylacetate-CoA ligase
MFAQYGSREIGTMGQECRRKDGYHYAQDVALMEVLDEKDEPTEHGNLVITYFGNQVVPLIRYLTGDAASIDTRPCECGLPYERVRNIDGRIASMIQLKDGRCLTSLILPHVFKDYIWIHEFQVEQRAPGSLVIRIQRSDTGFTAESFTKLQATVVSLWGSNMELEWRYNVPFLQVPTGKHVQFISTFSTAEASGEQCAS